MSSRSNNDSRRNHEAEHCYHEAIDRERRRYEEQRRRELERRLADRRYEQIRHNHPMTSGTTGAASVQASFSDKYECRKEDFLDSVVSTDGYESKCADGSSIISGLDYSVQKLKDGTQRIYRNCGDILQLCREDLPDGRSRAYDTRAGVRGEETFLRYECDAEGNYKCYGKKNEYGSWRQTDEVTEEGKISAFSTQASFSDKYECRKEDFLDSVVSTDGYESRCADGSFIFSGKNYYVQKLLDGTQRIYKDYGDFVQLCKEDLPDGRSRAYDTKKGVRGEETFLRYECDAEGNYKRYGYKDKYGAYSLTDCVLESGNLFAPAQAASSAKQTPLKGETVTAEALLNKSDDKVGKTAEPVAVGITQADIKADIKAAVADIEQFLRHQTAQEKGDKVNETAGGKTGEIRQEHKDTAQKQTDTSSFLMSLKRKNTR